MILGALFGACGWMAFGQVVKFERTYGGSFVDEAYVVRQTQDGGYIVAGNTGSGGTGNKVYLVRTDSTGDTLWTKALGGVINDYGYSVAQTLDGGFIVAGVTYNFGAGNGDALLIRTDSNGEVLWMKAYGGADYDEARSVVQTSDSGYAFVGTTSSYGSGTFFYIVRTKPNGDTLWTRSYGETGEDYGSCIQQCKDGGLVVVGTKSLSFSGGDVCLMRFSGSTRMVWMRSYPVSQQRLGLFVEETTDSGFIITGSTSSIVRSRDAYLMKTTSNGDTVWTRTYGGSNDDVGLCVRQTVDGGYILSGNTASYGAHLLDVLLVNTDENGTPRWTRLFGGNGFDEGRSVQQTSDGGYVIGGRTTSYGAGSFDAYVIKTDQNGIATSVLHEPNSAPQQVLLQQNYPNPFNPSTNIGLLVPDESFVRLTVFDVLGREVERLLERRLEKGSYSMRWDAEGVAAGVYYCQLTIGSTVETRKMILVR